MRNRIWRLQPPWLTLWQSLSVSQTTAVAVIKQLAMKIFYLLNGSVGLLGNLIVIVVFISCFKKMIQKVCFKPVLTPKKKKINNNYALLNVLANEIWLMTLRGSAWVQICAVRSATEVQLCIANKCTGKQHCLLTSWRTSGQLSLLPLILESSWEWDDLHHLHLAALQKAGHIAPSDLSASRLTADSNHNPFNGWCSVSG